MNKQGSKKHDPRLAPSREVPESWDFDPVLAAYRTLLKRAGAGKSVARATLTRWRDAKSTPPVTPTESAVSRKTRPVVSKPQPVLGEGSPDTAENGAETNEVTLRNPAALLLMHRHLPIRLDIEGEQLILTILSYTPSLRRNGDRATYGADSLKAAIRVARRGFVALQCTMSIYGGSRELFAAAPPTADESFLADELHYDLLTPTKASLDSTPVCVDGIHVHPGEWIWVRLETRSGLTMTEPAVFVGAEKVMAATQLTLRGPDGLTATCFTRGPGWVRRIVPVDDAGFWRLFSSTRPLPPSLRGVG